MKYNKFIKKLVCINFADSIFSRITIHPTYLMIHVKNLPFHITIFKDQWNEYPNKKYHLFHITHEDESDKCSSYFWVTNHLKIKNIPPSKFKYGQEDYSMFSSTRNYCTDKAIKVIRVNFQKLLNKF